MVLVTCLPSGSCHHVELSTYGTTCCWSHVCPLGVVIALNDQLMMLRVHGFGPHLPSGSCHIEFSSYNAKWCWSFVCRLGVVITLNYQLMMLHGVCHVSAVWQLSSRRIISLRCCIVSKSGILSPGTKTVMDLSMAYLSSRNGKWVFCFFF